MEVSLKLKEAEDTGQYSLPLVYFPSLHFPGEPSDLASSFHHPRVVEAEVTEQDSLLLTRNFLATALFNNRGLFYLNDEVSSRDHPHSNSQHVMMMNISLTGHGGTFKSTAADITLNQLRSSTFKMVPTLGELISTLDKMPDEPQPFFWDCAKVFRKSCCWDTSLSKKFSKPEVSLAGVTPRNKKRVETVKNQVHGYPNQTFTPPSLKTIFGRKLYNMCCSEEEPDTISCWFETFQSEEEADKSIYENQFLCWRSAKRSSKWRAAGVTRVDREWITRSEEDKNKVGPICPEQEARMLGAVRNQGDHQLCYAYVSVNLVSSLRVIDGLDKEFVNLSVKEMCFYASPSDRLLQTSTDHKCHPLQLTAGLDYIKEHGVLVQRGGVKEDSFDCVKDKPTREKKKTRIGIAERVYLGNDLYGALKRLEKQPLGATVVLFSDYWETKVGEVYRGPKNDQSEYDGLHGVTVADAFLMDGELVFWCKSSHGPEYHTKGYVLVSGEMMVMAHHFAAPSGNSTFGVNRGKRGGNTPLPLSSPTPLIHDFVYPLLKSGKRKSHVSNKRKR